MDLQLNELRQRLVKHGIGIAITKAAKEYLLENGYDAKNGVRPLRRLIADTIEDHIALELLDRKLKKGDIISINADEKELQYVAKHE